LPGIFISRSADATPIAPFLDKQDVEISLLACVTAYFCFLFLIEMSKPRARQYVGKTLVDAEVDSRFGAGTNRHFVSSNDKHQ
jgi:hypothetical protein